MLIMRHSEGKNVSGLLVEILQSGLNALGLTVGRVDGDFGAKTDAAVKLFQQRHELPETGDVDDQLWTAITGLPAPSLFDRLMQVLAAYEGTGFTGTAGNFDGAFLTYGIIGFTLKHDLPELIEAVEDAIPGEARQAFGESKWEELLRVSRSGATVREEFGNSISIGANKGKILESWRAAFRRLGRLPMVQTLQLRRAFQKYYTSIALRDFDRFSGSTVREVGLMFDTAIQNGGMNTKKTRLYEAAIANVNNPTVTQKMDVLANAIADGSAKRWHDDVLSRRLVWVNGNGIVHGANYIIDDWGIGQAAAETSALASDHITQMPSAFSPSVDTLPKPAVVTPNVNFLEQIDLPGNMNQGLTSPRNDFMLAKFGSPRADYDQDCRLPTDVSFRSLCSFNQRIEGFGSSFWGLTQAVDSLREVMADIKTEKPEIFAILGHVGMGCCRHVRGSTVSISNHSWGSAIDLTLDGVLDERGNGLIQRGIVEILPIFNRHKWFSGATFRIEDSMHMEVSQEWIEERFPDNPPQIDPNAISFGDRGNRVRVLQVLLQRKGFSITADGFFGPQTMAAVKRIQALSNLPVTGIVDEETLRAIVG